MSSPFFPFQMERMMSIWENAVEINLSESGVHPMAFRDLVHNPEMLEQILSSRLGYPQSNGSIELRERISALYPGSTIDNILVTTGCAEANFITLQTLLQPGDEIVMMLPNYMQIWGVAKNIGCSVRVFNLNEENGWAPDLDDIVSEKTKLIAICNPNNPTGYILTEKEMAAIVVAAERVGAWLLSDEVYAGAERIMDRITPSFWGRYHRVMAMGSLSKAYGLPGLRIGWIVGPSHLIDETWARHEYVTISTTLLSNTLAAIALAPEMQPQIIQRTRCFIRNGFSILNDWIKEHGAIFSLVPPQAAAIAFVRYSLNMNSTVFVERLIHEKSVLIVPGDHFGIDHHFRISFGLPQHYLRTGLERIHEFINGLARQ